MNAKRQHSVTATTSDGVRLHVEEAGVGTPILFIHEFAGDHRSWEPQMRFFSRHHRCVTYAARGFPPSDVPTIVDRYTSEHTVTDAVAVLDALEIKRAHIVGLSMGGFAALHLGLDHPDRVLSLTIGAAGYGCEKHLEAGFRLQCLEVADTFERKGATVFASVYAESASRVQFKAKDPRGWREFADRLASHSDIGSALTMRGVQAQRTSFWDLEGRLREMQVPTLILAGDEDDHCLQPALFLKRMLPSSGLVIFPRSGHTLNLEEPDFFNDRLAAFLTQVGAGTCLHRDPRANPGEILRSR